MDGNDASLLRTRASLLVRLQQSPDDTAAWGEFHSRYGPQVRDWCLRWGLQDADADDVTQTVLLRLSEKLREFRYDPTKRFRGWLRTITQNAWSDFHRDRNRHARATGDSAIVEVLHQVEARDDLIERLLKTFDHELLEQAYREVQARVEPRTWDAFYLTAVRGLRGAEAARQLGMNVGTVFVAKSKVQAMLQEIVRGCEEET